MKKRQEKKSESLEIRLPYSQKTAFIEACREQGISASEALRAQIDLFVEDVSAPQKPNRLGAAFDMIKRHRKKAIASLTALAASLSIGLALPSQADEPLFSAYDRNGDGVLTAGEISPNDSAIFAALDKDHSGEITEDEFDKNAEIVEIIDTIKPGENPGDPSKRLVGIERTTFELNGTDQVNVFIQQWTEEVDLNATESDIRNVVEGMKIQLDDVQQYERMADMDGEARIRVLRDIKNTEDLHTRMELDELKQIRIEIDALEDMGLNFEELKDLEELKKLESLKNLEALGELEGLEELKNMEIRIDLDFSDLPDFAELDKELAMMAADESLDLSEEERAEISAARAELARARTELEQLKEESSRVFIIRKEISTSDDGEHGDHKVKVRVETHDHSEHAHEE